MCSYKSYKTILGIGRGEFPEVNYVVPVLQRVIVFLRRKVHGKLVNRAQG